jgi:formamidopyrimidine-DNA glycosylase
MLAKSIVTMSYFMPELPEVETCKNGIYHFLIHQTIQSILIRQPKLRWPVPENLLQIINGKPIINITRRAKYILIHFEHGYLVIHLGMSGHLKILTHSNISLEKHDHVIFLLSNGVYLRYHDPRRFGCILWVQAPLEEHKLFKHLGPEPLEPNFNADVLFTLTRKKTLPIKLLIMNQAIVVGVGNIYANEALFISKIHPQMPANQLTLQQSQVLVKAIQQVLSKAIQQGGTTLNDFKNAEGKSGYFKQELSVYGRKEEPCFKCKTPIQHLKLGQRSTYFCPNCQTY